MLNESAAKHVGRVGLGDFSFPHHYPLRLPMCTSSDDTDRFISRHDDSASISIANSVL